METGLPWWQDFFTGLVVEAQRRFNPDAQTQEEAEFLRQISDATLDSLLSMHAAREKAGDLPVVKICRLKKPRQQYGPQSKDYSALYCLNNEALAMCEDLQLSLQILGEVNDLPTEVSYDLEAHYLPKTTIE